MDIGKELRVIEVEEHELETVEIEVVEANVEKEVEPKRI